MMKLISTITTINVLLVLAEEVVKTPLGDVKGFYKQSFDNKTFLAFEGIPYAKPPVGDLRFVEPQPPEKWTGTLVANKTYSCWTYSAVRLPFGPEESEDCLYVYVYVPREKINGDENLDVVAHIHGGGFMLGSPAIMTSPDYIMDEDVVLVTFNYRLGIFGFLSTEDDIVPGNNGLKDQNRALIWIKENIRYFGGNPNSVTLTGLSAGASSVHYHYLSPMSKGLFHRGLAQSGTVLLPWALVEKPLQKAKKVANQLECPTDSTKSMIDCLKKNDAKDIKEATKVLYVYLNGVPNTVFGPTLENTSNPFLTDHPYKLLNEGNIYDVPLITSNVQDEGIFPVGLLMFIHKLEDIDSKWDTLIPYFCDFYDTVADNETMIDVAKKVKEHYFQNRPLNANTSREFIQLFNDRMYFVDTEKALRLHSKANKSPLYYYWFSYSIKRKSVLSFGLQGATHSDDARLFLQITGAGKLYDPEDVKMMKMFIGMIATYAKTGIPSINDVEWKPVTPNKKEIDYLEIGAVNNIEMKKRDTIGDTDFWNSLPIQENDKLF